MLNLPVEEKSYQEESKHQHSLNPQEYHLTAHHVEAYINKSKFDFEAFRGDE